MMNYSNVGFEATVAIGEHGTAVLSLSEKPLAGWVLDNDSDCDCVKNDIIDCGACGWIDYLPNKPESSGVYLVRGEGLFTEDDAQYEKCEFTPMPVIDVRALD